MATYLTPGVYVEEIPTLPGSVAPLATAVPAFVGYTKKGFPVGWPRTVTTDPPLPPVIKRITSLFEFEEFFGGPYLEFFKVTKNYPTNTITVELAEAVTPLTGAIPLSPYLLYFSIKLYFQNGGGPCYISSVGGFLDYDEQEILEDELTAGMTALAAYDEPTLLCIPESILTDTGYSTLIKGMLTNCFNLRDRFALIDPQEDSVTLASLATFRTDAAPTNLNALQYGAAYLPRLKSIYEYPVNGASKVKIIHPLPPTPDPPLPDTDTDMGALQTSNPSLYKEIIAAILKTFGTKVLPASPAMAGIYCTVDRDRGVWKAPANVGVTGIVNLTMFINDEEQARMNVDSTGGKSINAIRNFTGRGTLVWGARTLAGNDLEWRYVPVRRFFMFVEESIQEALSPVVFEPNTAVTWERIKGMVTGFLTNLWRQGALAGTKPEHAFFVNVGLGVTMTPEDILEGRLIVDVGLAAIRPAEFIVTRFMHKMQEI
jgi:phage tail sheath protein FI